MDRFTEIPPLVRDKLLAPNSFVPWRRVANGLSGAQIWQCRNGTRLACLRNWPPQHPEETTLKFIHHAISIAVEADLGFVPQLYRASDGASYLNVDSEFWELTEWLPGKADYVQSPNFQRLAAAMTSLAKLHKCWRKWRSEQGPSPAISRRIYMLSDWMRRIASGEVARHSISNSRTLQLAHQTISQLELQAPYLITGLNESAQKLWSLHPVLRDVWSDHVLFLRDEVSGIIDYGAMNVDCPAIDLARLLGSLEPADPDARERGVGLYLRCCNSCELDWSLVDKLDQVGTILACGQWYDWLVAEHRQFAQSLPQLQDRWQSLLNRTIEFSKLSGRAGSRIWLP